MTPTEHWSYGQIIRTYSGHGQVVGPSGNAPCTFEIVQLSSGRIAARCEAESGLSFRWCGTVVSLRGVTSSDQTVEVDHALVTEEEAKWSTGSRAMTLRLSCRAVRVRSRNGPAGSLRYGLTNLDYRLQLQLAVDGYTVVTRAVEDARQIQATIRAQNGIAVTAEATVVASLELVDAVDQTIGDLCLLLSLARGHGVTWVYREALDANGHVIEAFHGDAVTKPWGGQELIPLDTTQQFLLATYPRFRAANERWDLTRAIRGLTDAKIESHYLEARALQMVIVMEHLQSRYLRRTGGECILPESEFERGVRVLEMQMRPMLQGVFESASEVQINGLLRNLRALNRPTFRETLRALCREFGVPISGKEKTVFVQIRNALVHTLTLMPGREAWKQYCLLGTVVSKVLLGTLAWQGEYRDWSKDPEKLERLELKLGDGHSP